MASLYEKVIKAGCEVDSHESDLYVKATPEAEAVLAAADAERGGARYSRTYFRHAVTGELWLDIPFMFDPYWKARGVS